jgi:flavodoxin
VVLDYGDFAMTALVLYESFFGNTQKVAETIAEALGDAVRLEPVDRSTPELIAAADLVVVGSATRAFNPCPATSSFLNRLKAGSLAGKKVAAFDTRMDVTTVNNGFLTFMAGLFGYAAEKIDRRLTRRGGSRAGTPAGFMVEGTEGPLRTGEIERAAAWAKSLLS